MGTDYTGIQLVAFDVDGTLTDGAMLYGPDGVYQTFNSKDGQGIMRLLDAGIHVAFISFRDFPGTRRRAADLGVKYLCLGSKDKAESLSSLAQHLKLPLNSVLFMGDDSKDIPAMNIAGFTACPSDAAPDVKVLCSLVTDSPGGKGAVREVADAVLGGSS